MRMRTTWFLALLAIASRAASDPTWPSPTDELEEIMFQTDSVGSRNFANSVSPCSNQAAGSGRRAAAEWLRTAFHDMAQHNRLQQVGGLDASLQYELRNGDNAGPAFERTLRFMAPYLSRRSSLADLVALGVYTAVRTCGGPAVPVRAGRVDARAAGAIGVPQPQNAIGIFRNQFTRMGFSNEEMIQLVACGHTLGSVHSAEHPEIIPVGAQPNDQVSFDTTVAAYDNRVVTEYLNWNTTNPLVVGRAATVNRHSDWKVYSSDGNVTVRALADPAVYQSTCRTVLQKMIDTVPAGVTLGAPIQPYDVKPVDIQVLLGAQSNVLEFSGSIRVRTTVVPRSTLAGIVIDYRNRAGDASCGQSPCSFSVAAQGIGRGIGEEFVWFPFTANIPVDVGISSFTVTVYRTDGTAELHDNNGNGYPVQDAVFLQRYQSCLLQTSGTFTLTAAVRNDRANLPVRAFVSYKTDQSNSPVPALTSVTLDLTRGVCNGAYTFFSVSTTIPGNHSAEADFDIISGTGSSAVTESFRKTRILGGTCRSFASSGTCSVPGGPSTTTSVSTSQPPAITSSMVASTTSSIAPLPPLYHRQAVGGYRLVSCWTEGVGVRALSGAAFAYTSMTLESCMANCTGFAYWGTEYSTECYCGNALHGSSTFAPLAECNMVCGGDDTQYCGAGNRLELYSTTATLAPTSTSSAPSNLPTIPPFTLVGCQAEGVGARALSGAMYASSTALTLPACAAFCAGFRYFGTEFSTECWCGNALHASSTAAPLTDCAMPCSGAPAQYCGGPNRLTLYEDPSFIPAVAPRQPPIAGPFVFLACRAEEANARALSARATTAPTMTNAACAAFCDGFRYFGTEFSIECYCGDALPELAAEVDAAECGMPCAGAGGELCGGRSRLSVYTRRGDDAQA